MTSTQVISIAVVISLVAIALSIANIFSTPRDAQGSAFSGIPASVATTSQMLVNTTQSRILATSSCSARIITTTASPIMLSFSEITNFVPSGLYGHLQAASTTVAYDSGLYGCGSVRVYSFVSGEITVTDVR